MTPLEQILDEQKKQIDAILAADLERTELQMSELLTMMPTDQNWLDFCAAWLASGKGERTAASLLPIAEVQQVELRGETTRARQTSLGKLLKRHEGVPIEHQGYRLTVRRGRLAYGKQWWKIETSYNVQQTPL